MISNDVIIEHISRRIIEKNGNAFIIVTGDVGSGKSYAALDLCLKLSQKFDTPFNEDWVQFSSEGMFRAVLKEHKKGQCVLMDEMGVIMSNRRAMARGNVGLSFLLQTIRSQNHILVFTVPDFSFVDKVARLLIHYKMESNARFRNNKNHVLFQRKMKVRYSDKVYFAPIPYSLPDGTIRDANTYVAERPPQWLVDVYEEKKKKFQIGLWEKISGDNLKT